MEFKMQINFIIEEINGRSDFENLLKIPPLHLTKLIFRMLPYLNISWYYNGCITIDWILPFKKLKLSSVCMQLFKHAVL